MPNKWVYLFNEIDLTYVSCSPYRVPVARLAAAHAALLDKSYDTRRGIQRVRVQLLCV